MQQHPSISNSEDDVAHVIEQPSTDRIRRQRVSSRLQNQQDLDSGDDYGLNAQQAQALGRQSPSQVSGNIAKIVSKRASNILVQDRGSAEGGSGSGPFRAETHDYVQNQLSIEKDNAPQKDKEIQIATSSHPKRSINPPNQRSSSPSSTVQAAQPQPQPQPQPAVVSTPLMDQSDKNGDQNSKKEFSGSAADNQRRSIQPPSSTNKSNQDQDQEGGDYAGQNEMKFNHSLTPKSSGKKSKQQKPLLGVGTSQRTQQAAAAADENSIGLLGAQQNLLDSTDPLNESQKAPLLNEEERQSHQQIDDTAGQKNRKQGAKLKKAVSKNSNNVSSQEEDFIRDSSVSSQDLDDDDEQSVQNLESQNEVAKKSKDQGSVSSSPPDRDIRLNLGNLKNSNSNQRQQAQDGGYEQAGISSDKKGGQMAQIVLQGLKKTEHNNEEDVDHENQKKLGNLGPRPSLLNSISANIKKIGMFKFNNKSSLSKVNINRQEKKIKKSKHSNLLLGSKKLESQDGGGGSARGHRKPTVMFDADVVKGDSSAEEAISEDSKSKKDQMFGGVIKNKVSRKNTLMNKQALGRTKSILLSAKRATDLQMAFEKGKQKLNFSNDDTSEDESSTSTSDDSDYSENQNKPFQSQVNALRGQIQTVFDDFAALYSNAPHTMNQRNQCIIMSNNPIKIFWDFLILFLLIIVCIFVPYHLAFESQESKEWLIFYYAIDICFFIDIILTFFTSISDSQEVHEITNRKAIAKVYLQSWFAIDIVSILPINLAIEFIGVENEGSLNGEINSLVRFFKIGKLYKLIRLVRLAKVLKLLKSRKTVMAQFTSKMKINSGVERIFFSLVFFLFFFHIMACMFIMLAEFDQDRDSWLQDPTYFYMDHIDLYITSCYFVVTTMSTVGYGDISAGTRHERVFCTLLMFIGVVSFNFISGALASIISSYDSTQAILQERLLYLNKLRAQVNISDDLYFEIKKALQYDSKSNFEGLDQFIEKLPVNLRLEISEEIHRENFAKFDLFKKIGTKYFLMWIGSRFKSRLFTEQTYFYQRGDVIDNFFFQVTGMSAFVMQEHQNRLYAVVDPETYVYQKATRKGVLQNFGIEDSVVNNTAIEHDNGPGDDDFMFSRNGIRSTNRRYYSVQCISNSEVLCLSMQDIDRMKRDFTYISRNFIRIMIKQTQKLLNYQLSGLQQVENLPQIILSRNAKGMPMKSKHSRNFESAVEKNQFACQMYMKSFSQKDDLNYKTISFLSSDNSSQIDNEQMEKNKFQKNQVQDSPNSKLPNKDFESPDPKGNLPEFASDSPPQASQSLKKSLKTGFISIFNRMSTHKFSASLTKDNREQKTSEEQRPFENEVDSIMQNAAQQKRQSFSRGLTFTQKIGDNEALSPKNGDGLLVKAETTKEETKKEPTPKLLLDSQKQQNKNEIAEMFDVEEKVGSQIAISSGISLPKKSKANQRQKNVKRKITEDRETFKKRMIGEMKGQKKTDPNNSDDGGAYSSNSLEKKDKKEEDSSKNSEEEFDQVPALLSKKNSQQPSKNERKRRSFKRTSTEYIQPTFPNPRDIIPDPSAEQAEKALTQQASILKSQHTHSYSSKYTMFANPGGSQKKDSNEFSKEVESKFCQKILEEKPEGTKGLAYVLLEIRRAQAEGILPRTKNSKHNQHNLLGKVLKRVVSTKLDQTSKVKELLKCLSLKKEQILTRMIQEQGFVSQESTQQSNQKFISEIVAQQKVQLDVFFDKVGSQLQNMKAEINEVKKQVKNVKSQE